MGAGLVETSIISRLSEGSGEAWTSPPSSPQAAPLPGPSSADVRELIFSSLSREEDGTTSAGPHSLHPPHPLGQGHFTLSILSPPTHHPQNISLVPLGTRGQFREKAWLPP